MRPFSYARAASPADATGQFRDGAAYLGGGTNLVDLMRLGVETPAMLVDVTGIVGREIVDGDDGGLVIGAGVTNSDLAVDPRVRQAYPMLSQALLNGASGQLRNLATVGGNLLQRTRCVYFQDVSKPCNKRALGSGCPARAGEHRNLAVIGHSEHCVATHPSDMAVALTALDARVRVSGPGGERVIGMGDLHRLPGDRPDRDTVLELGELITAVELAPLPVAAASTYRKVRERRSFAFALVSVAAALTVQDGVVGDVRLAFGGVAHRPWRAAAAEAALRGGPATGEALAAAVDAELAPAQPLEHNAYKLPLLRRVASRTLAELAGLV